MYIYIYIIYSSALYIYIFIIIMYIYIYNMKLGEYFQDYEVSCTPALIRCARNYVVVNIFTKLHIKLAPLWCRALLTCILDRYYYLVYIYIYIYKIIRGRVRTHVGEVWPIASSDSSAVQPVAPLEQYIFNCTLG